MQRVEEEGCRGDPRFLGHRCELPAAQSGRAVLRYHRHAGEGQRHEREARPDAAPVQSFLELHVLQHVEVVSSGESGGAVQTTQDIYKHRVTVVVVV